MIAMDQHILALMLENSDDDNILEIIINFQENLLENNFLEEIYCRTLHLRNENYFEITVPQYSLSDFHAHFRMTRRTMEVKEEKSLLH